MAFTQLFGQFGGVLGRRLLFWVLLISGVNALAGASVQVYLDYRRDIDDLTENLAFIETGAAPAIAQAAWNFDRVQVQTQIIGVANSRWVSGVSVRYGPSENVALSFGVIDVDLPGVRQYALRYGGAVGSGEGVPVGRLYVQPNWSEIYRRTADRLQVIFATQLVKAFVFTFCLLWLVSALIIRPLRRMAAFAHDFTPGKPFEPLFLRRQKRRPDELTDLQDSLNNAYARLNDAHAAEQRHIERLEARVAERTEELRAAVAALAASEQAMRELAHHDSLTGLANRKLLEERLSLAVVRAQRCGRHVVVLLVDLNNFKEINDRFGHAAGDALLQALARRMRGLLRENDTLARLGGDEFVVVLDDMDPDANIERPAADFAAAIAAPWEWEGATIYPSASIGSARFPENGAAVCDLLRAADVRMYAEKRRHRAVM